MTIMQIAALTLRVVVGVSLAFLALGLALAVAGALVGFVGVGA